MDSAAKEQYSDSLDEMECASCKGNVTPPVKVCVNGHCICDKCRRILDTCHACGETFPRSRNSAVESIKRLSMSEIQSQTEGACPFATASGSLCSWSGKLDDIKKHLLQNHDKKIADKSGKFSMPFTSVTPQASYSLVFLTLGEVFIRKAQIKDDNFYLAVMYIGPPKNANKYKYSFTISKKNSVENISVCQRTRSFLENCDDIYSSRNCIKLHYDVVADFLLDSKDLPNIMEVSKA